MTTVNLQMDPAQEGITGFVALLGRPNTGKSTLLNTLLGCHLAAVSNKPQTTRKYMLGIFNDKNSQIMFLDSPGVHAGNIAIDEAMAKSVERVMEDADVVVCMIDPTREPGAEDGMVAQLASKSKKPILLLFNKADLTTPEQQAISSRFYRKYLPDAPDITLIAHNEASAASLIVRLKKMLPHGIFLYDRDEVTNIYERDIAAELIREVLLLELEQEIPHCIAVTIDRWKELKTKEIMVEATLNLEREAHKGIVIGKGGRMIKRLRKMATAKLIELCQCKVTLELFIKIVPNWRKKKQFLKEIKLLD
ncbi:MAG: GTPase Era [Lentisphaeria bacterium]